MIDRPLRDAVWNGDLPEVRRLVAQGVDLEARNDNGYTLLHLAIENDRVDVVKFLLEAGTDPNGLTTGGLTPLCNAIEVAGDAARQLQEEQSTAIVELLLAHGADVNRPCVWHRRTKSPLAEASYWDNRKAVALLLAAGATLREGEAVNLTASAGPIQKPPWKPGYEWNLGILFVRIGLLGLLAAGACKVAGWAGMPADRAAGPLAGTGILFLCGGAVYLLSDRFLP